MLGEFSYTKPVHAVAGVGKICKNSRKMGFTMKIIRKHLKMYSKAQVCQAMFLNAIVLLRATKYSHSHPKDSSSTFCMNETKT